METSSLQNCTHVCDIPVQMKQDFIETRTTCNARKSLAWDSAFFTSPGFLEPEELFQTLNAKKCSNSLSALNLEQENLRESGNFSSRKSLAWDNAFFSEEGVLNPEELSIVNRGFKKHATHLPPGINKLWRSTESSLTTGSEGSSLTRLEMDLFEDIRKSVPKRGSSSRICTSSLKLERGAALNNSDVPSKTKAKAVPSSRRQNTTIYASLRESHFLQPTKLKQAAGNGEHYTPSNLKPPKSERHKNISTPTTKRPSPGGHDIKSNNKNKKEASAQYLNGTKKPCFRDPYNPIFSSMPLLKGCLSTSLVDVAESTLRSPRCMPSKSPSFTSRKISNKIKTRNATTVTSGTPLRNTRSKKIEVENSSEPPLLCTPKSSSSLSSASSMGKGSSQSSVSTTKRYDTHKTILAKQCGKVLMELDLDCRPDRKTFDGYGNIQTQHGKKCMTVHHSPMHSSKQNMPSSLRMPSPSIGYFDTENLQLETIVGEFEIQSQASHQYYQSMKLQCPKGCEKSPAMVKRKCYTSQKAAPNNKAGGEHGEISRKMKRESKENTYPKTGRDGSKENMRTFEDQVENLVRYVGVLDLSH